MTEEQKPVAWVWNPQFKKWDPVTNDFDSVPMGMVEVWQEDGEDPLHIEYFKRGDDRLIVTRRAIVRAAATIGRAR